MAAKPVALIVSGWPFGSAAKLSGAEMVEPVAVQVVASISAMKASLKALVRREGYSSERKRRSNETHDACVRAGLTKGICSTVTSRADDDSAAALGERGAAVVAVREGARPIGGVGLRRVAGRHHDEARVVERERNEGAGGVPGPDRVAGGRERG